MRATAEVGLERRHASWPRYLPPPTLTTCRPSHGNRAKVAWRGNRCCSHASSPTVVEREDGASRVGRQRRASKTLLKGLLATLLKLANPAPLAMARIRARGPTQRDQLTPQELQIALLLAGGRTTREAAAALSISPKTVEYNLRSVYRKLGIGPRGELAAAVKEGEAPS